MASYSVAIVKGNATVATAIETFVEAWADGNTWTATVLTATTTPPTGYDLIIWAPGTSSANWSAAWDADTTPIIVADDQMWAAVGFATSAATYGYDDEQAVVTGASHPILTDAGYTPSDTFSHGTHTGGIDSGTSAPIAAGLEILTSLANLATAFSSAAIESGDALIGGTAVRRMTAFLPSWYGGISADAEDFMMSIARWTVGEIDSTPPPEANGSGEASAAGSSATSGAKEANGTAAAAAASSSAVAGTPHFRTGGGNGTAAGSSAASGTKATHGTAAATASGASTLVATAESTYAPVVEAITIDGTPSAGYLDAIERGGQYVSVIELIDAVGDVVFTTDVDAPADQQWAVTTSGVEYDRSRTSQRAADFVVTVPEARRGDLVPSSHTSPLHPRAGSRIRVSAGYRTGAATTQRFTLATLTVDRVTGEDSGTVALAVRALDAAAPLDTDFAAAFVIEAGTNVIDAVLTIIGQVFDLDSSQTFVSAASSEWVTPRIDAEPGDNRRDLIDRLLTAIGYQLIVDPWGRIVIDAVPSTVAESGRWTYGDDGVTIADVSRDWIGPRAGAGVRVTGGAIGDDADPVDLQLWDSDPTSDTYFDPGAGTGTHAQTDQLDNEFILHPQQAVEAGYARMRAVVNGGAVVEFTARPNPALRAGDPISLTYASLGIGAAVWRAETISLPIQADGAMAVTARRSWDPAGGAPVAGRPVVTVRTTVFVDDFERPDEDLRASGDWEEVGYSFNVRSGESIDLNDAWCFAVHTQPLDATDHYAQATIGNVPTVAGEAIGVMVRSGGQFDGYGLLARSSTLVELVKFSNGQIAATLGTYTHGSSVAGLVVELQADGPTLTGILDGVAVVTATDHDYPAGTYVGHVGRGRYDEVAAPSIGRFETGANP